MGKYIDDERQSLQPLGPRQQGWPQTPHLRRRSGSMGLRTRFSPLAPCSWGVCDQSILIFGCDSALKLVSPILFWSFGNFIPGARTPRLRPVWSHFIKRYEWHVV